MEKKKAIVRSKKGVKYEVELLKAKDLIDNYGCEWIGGEKLTEDKPKKEDVKAEENEVVEDKPKRKRRTKSEIEAEQRANKAVE